MLSNLDSIDKKILKTLQEDASLSATDLGDLVGLSQAACWRRIQRLETEGYIKKRVALLDPAKIGLGTIVLAHVKLSAHGRAHLDDFAEKIRSLPNVLECFVILGDQDFFLKIAVNDIYEYERLFFEKLSALDGVSEIRSSIALTQIKNETALPIN